ncbi:cupin-like domain-containing protein [Spongiimicrobium salis]|uniref:cupin-like domain-containing protein n=1 Tax=Spongiimicrobium salis TaxID=1667022 RepID=UPI00374CCD9F
MKIDKVKKLSKEDFLTNYLTKNKPVVVTDAMDDWDLNRFQPDSLKKEFGAEYTQVYNDLFDLQNVSTLESYLTSNFSKPEENCKEYIRWYTKLKDLDFLWSDDIFKKLKTSWNQPYFLPVSDTIVPYCSADNEIDITTERFPYKGLFISGKGAKTRLHRDPFNSNAILCQLYGEKQISLFSPDQAPYLMNDNEFVDIKNPNLDKFPDFPKAKPTFELTLAPNEVILFPAGWFHDVTSISDSISITWNFVHASELTNFQSFITKHPEDDQLEIVKFFLKDFLSADATPYDISKFLESTSQV